MGTPVVIALIGAGSAQVAAGIVRDLCVTPGLHGSQVVLMDVDARRLESIHRLAGRLAGELKVDLRFRRTPDREDALKGADFVINTAQVGGHDWTEAQRALAEQHGFYRGARLHDFGQALFFLDVARDVERLCPKAWLIQSANPVFEGCTLMARETNVNVLGLCHGHYGWHHIARVLGLEREHVTATSAGFNHWIFMTDFRHRGRDAYPLLDEWIATKAEAFWADAGGSRSYGDVQMSRAAIHQYRLFGLMPIGDTPRFLGWWYHLDLEAKRRWYNPWGGFDSEIGWGQYLKDMAVAAERVERAARDLEKPITDTFPARQSGEQIVPIMDSLVNDKPRVFQVNVPNRNGALPGFPEDLVVELPGLVSGAGIAPLSQPPLPVTVLSGAMIPRWHQAEMTVNALRTGDRNLFLLSLLASHKCRGLEQADRLLAAWLADPRNARVAALLRPRARPGLKGAFPA